MDNSSIRIAELLKIASIEEQKTQVENHASQTQHFFEEQPDEPLGKDNKSRPLTPKNNSTGVDCNISKIWRIQQILFTFLGTVIADLAEESLNTHYLMCTPRKKCEPSFILEIFDDEEETKAKLQLSPAAKKYKLCNPSALYEANNHTRSSTSADTSLDESQRTESLECNMNNSKLNISFDKQSVRYVCRRRRFHSNTEVSTPKRFKLA